jgi:hypothetical protein
VYNTAPTGTSTFPAAVLELRDELDKALKDAVFRGNAAEDDSAGFALASDPAARSKQMALRDYALPNDAVILDVLETSADPRQRSFAATALGYAARSPRQIAALVRASFDPEDDVRNNAVRALDVLSSATPDVGSEIPMDRFIQLLASGTWSDRNKGGNLFLLLSRSREAGLLTKLRAEALDSLFEMAGWRSKGHAAPARVILGRIAGIDEQHLNELVFLRGTADEILSAFAPSR